VTVPATALHAHRFLGFGPGPRLLFLGAVHGNETCGTRALERLVAELAQGNLRIARGALTVVPVTNPLAYARGLCEGDRNLNRALMARATPREFEDHVANVLCTLFAEHDVLVDFHSFHAPGEPFVLVGPNDNEGAVEPFAQAREEETLAAHLGPRRIVEGWMSAYTSGVRRRRGPEANEDDLAREFAYGIGTTERMRASGGYAVTIECGQHEDPEAPEVAYHAARQALALLGLVDENPAPAQGPFEVLRLREVVDRAHEGDRFVRAWKSFDPVEAGELVAVFADGRELRAPQAGRVVFPNPSAEVGTEWVYFAHASDRRIGAA
jgi:predicted deacylase